MLPRIAHVAEKSGTGIGIVGLLFLGFVSFADMWTIRIGWVVISVLEALLSVGAFSVAVAATGLLLIYEIWRSGTPDDERITAGPPVEAIVPAYRDADVVDESVSSLLENDYDPLSITVVVEPDDDRTRERAAELARRHDAVEWLTNAIPGSKATAINTAVEASDADHFVVFDADERASPEFVSTAMCDLTADADVFQGRRVPRPTDAIGTIAYCERVIVQAGYLVGELVGFTHCQSSATGFTREAFDAVGGYADMLTEDIYFSHQCHRADLTVSRNSRCTSSMETPHTLRDLWGQRKRWRIGHVQVVHRRIYEALEGDLGVNDLVTIGRSVGAVLAGGVLLVLSAQVLLLFIFGFEAAFVPFASIFVTILGVWARDAIDGRVGIPSWSVALAPVVYFGHGVLTVKALFEYALTWDGEWYQVTKTGN